MAKFSKRGIALLFCLFFSASLPLLSQSDRPITLSFLVQPLYYGEGLTYDDIVADFEAAHPNVDVVPIEFEDNERGLGVPAYSGMEEYLHGGEYTIGMSEYAQMADVLPVRNWEYLPEATRTGYFLDLSPLTQADSNLNIDDFYPAAWQSFQWDGSIWALPSMVSPIVWMYDANAFDAAGLAYPSDNWTMTEFEAAAKALAQMNPDGSVAKIGVYSFNMNELLRVMVGEPLYSSDGSMLVPNVNRPEVEAFFRDWQNLENDGFVSLLMPSDYDPNDDPNELPLQTTMLPFVRPDDEISNWEVALLPGGVASLWANGYAVSAATAEPQLAYELAQYLTTRTEPFLTTPIFMPARRSLLPSLEALGYFDYDIKDWRSVMEDYLEVALPSSAFLFAQYTDEPLFAVIDGADPAAVLLAAQIEAEENLAIASAERENANLVVATLVPTVAPNASESVLRIGVESLLGTNFQTEDWQQFNTDFAEAEPSVLRIEQENMNAIGFAASEYDCFYTPYNALAFLPSETILNQAPLMTVDANFNPDNFLPNVLEQATLNDSIWGYPLALYPDLLWVNAAVAEELSLELAFDWSVDDFAIAQALFQEQFPNETFLAAEMQDNYYLLMLMASYEGVLLDYKSNPAGLDLRSESSIAAAQTILDLARNGSIAPQFGTNALPFIYASSTSISSNYASNGYLPLNYPRNADYTPVSYSVGMGYISADSQNPQACYNWFTALAQRPDLLSGMPVQKTVLATAADFIGAEQAAFYQSYAAILETDATTFFAGRFANVVWQGDFVEQIWLKRVFDAYVLEGDSNLAENFAEAETYISAFRACLGGAGTINACARAVDPSLATDSRIGS